MTPMVKATVHHLPRGRPLASPPKTLVHTRIRRHAKNFLFLPESPL